MTIPHPSAQVGSFELKVKRNIGGGKAAVFAAAAASAAAPAYTPAAVEIAPALASVEASVLESIDESLMPVHSPKVLSTPVINSHK